MTMSSSNSLKFYTVDAFTCKSFGGNPAAVIVFDASDPRSQDEQLLQNIAAEFNLSETAYCIPEEGSDESNPKYLIRWFTPSSGKFEILSPFFRNFTRSLPSIDDYRSPTGQ